MQSVSLELREFTTAPNENEQGLSLNQRVLLKDIIIKLIRKPPVGEPFRVTVYYIDGAAPVAQINYTTFVQEVPFQHIFLSRTQAEHFKKLYCNFILFKFLNPAKDKSTLLNIAAYKFDDENERESFLQRIEHNKPHDGTFPDYGDAL